MKKMVVWLILGLTAVFLAACADENSETPATSVHALSWSEATNLNGTDFHGYGLAVYPDDFEPCMGCHGLDLLGSSDIPGCTDCHDAVDGGHLPGNELPEVHGTRALADFQICQLCHGEDYLGGIVGVSCAACHSIPWPHPANAVWMNKAAAGFHGAAADTALEREDCKRCHGSDLQGGSTLVSCYTCHFDETGARYPAGLSHHDNHPDMEAYTSTCNTCHNVNRSYGNSPGGCHDCHGDGP